MIAADQPTIFSKKIIAAVSSAKDGSIGLLQGDPELALLNRFNFLERVGIEPHNTTLLRVIYDDTSDFSRYHIANDTHKGEWIFNSSYNLVADALVATQPGHALFLPLADCVGAIIYDTKQRILMVSHLGRHSTEQQGATKSIQYLKDRFQTEPRDLQVWLSPAVGKATYPLKNLQNKGLHEALLEQLIASNVPRENIQLSTVDTATNENYFSHSRFLAGEKTKKGRFAIVAMMRE